MRKKNTHSNQIFTLAIALFLALAVVIISAFILSSKIRSNDNNFKINSSENSPTLSIMEGDISAQDSSKTDKSVAPKDEKTEIDNSTLKADMAENDRIVSQKAAVEYLSYTSYQLIDEFSDVYEDYGYINGGYTIANYDVCPNMKFAVQADEGTILDERISAVTVAGTGKVMDDVFIGMTYKEIKAVLGDKLVPIQQDEANCVFAIVEMKNYTVTFEFEFAGGQSVSATILGIS